MTGASGRGRLATEDGNVTNTPIASLRYLSRALIATAAVFSVVVLALAMVTSAAGSARAQSGSLDGDSLGAQGEPHLYLAQQGEDRIAAVPLGGGPETTVVDGLDGPQGLAVADGTLFISEDGGRVVSVSTDGGDPEVVATGLSSPRGLLVVGDLLYIADSANNRVVAAPTDGRDLDGDDLEVIAGDGLNSPRDLAVHGDTLFIADRHNDRVVTAPIEGGDIEEFYTSNVELAYLEVSDGTLYFSEFNVGSVWSMPVDGSEPPEARTDDLNEVRGVAVSGDTLFISEKGDGRVLSQPIGDDDLETETLVELDNVYDIAVEPTPCTDLNCLPVVGSLFGSLG